MAEDRWNYSGFVVCEAPEADRMAFLQKTYLHLSVAVLAFVAFCGLFLQFGLPIAMMTLMAQSKFVWLIFLLVFSGIGSVAQNLARSHSSPTTQYLGLGVYVILEAALVSPLLYVACEYDKGAVLSAAVITGTVFVGMTAVVMFIKRDFSFLGNILSILTFGAMGLIICSIIFGFNLGVLFSFGMVLVASGYILYNTSKIFQNYPTDAYVAASLELFASLALLFWYVLRLIMNRRR